MRDRAEDTRRVCNEIIDRICARGECDFVWDIAARLPLILIANDLGVEPEDRDQLLEWSDAMLSTLVGDPAAANVVSEAFSGYREFALRAIADRWAADRDDVMSTLVHAEIDGRSLTDDDIISESLLILIGGDETSRHVISGGAYQLLTGDCVWDRLSAERHLMGSAVEAMLRYVSPIKSRWAISSAEPRYVVYRSPGPTRPGSNRSCPFASFRTRWSRESLKESLRRPEN